MAEKIESNQTEAYRSIPNAGADMGSEQAADLGTMFSHHTAAVNGVRLHYVMGGEGPPVLLLHGWPQTWWEWRRIMPALAERFTVIALDLRGFGDSEKPESGYDVANICADILALLDHLAIDTVRLVGHDLGGLVAYGFARLHADRVERLVLADTRSRFSVSRLRCGLRSRSGSGIWVSSASPTWPNR